jgi:hypothetical protein
MTSDSTECPIKPDFIVYQAASMLHRSRIRGTDADSENHRTQADALQGLADRERARLKTRLPAGCRAVIEMI